MFNFCVQLGNKPLPTHIHTYTNFSGDELQEYLQLICE